MSSLTPNGPKKNHLKGIANARKAEKRAEAEERQVRYASKSLVEKYSTAGEKELAKLEAKEREKRESNV